MKKIIIGGKVHPEIKDDFMKSASNPFVSRVWSAFPFSEKPIENEKLLHILYTRMVCRMLYFVMY